MSGVCLTVAGAWCKHRSNEARGPIVSRQPLYAHSEQML